MHLEYDIRVDDLNELNIDVAKEVQKPRKNFGDVLAVIVFTGFTVGYLLYVMPKSGPDSVAAWSVLFIPCVAYSVIALTSGMALARNWRRRFEVLVGPGAILFFLAFFAASQVVEQKFWGIPAFTGWTWNLLTPHWLWLLMVGYGAFDRVRRSRRGLKALWESTPSLQQPHIAEITDTGITVSSPGMQHVYQWLAFIRWAETPSLFLFYLGRSNAIMIPKRSLAGVDEVKALRAIAQSASKPKQPGFPVVLAATPVSITSHSTPGQPGM